MIDLFLSLALAAAVAPDAAAEPAAPSTQTAAKPAKPKKICQVQRKTGSTINKRVCKTVEDWNSQDNTQSLDITNQSYKQNLGNGN